MSQRNCTSRQPRISRQQPLEAKTPPYIPSPSTKAQPEVMSCEYPMETPVRSTGGVALAFPPEMLTSARKCSQTRLATACFQNLHPKYSGQPWWTCHAVACFQTFSTSHGRRLNAVPQMLESRRDVGNATLKSSTCPSACSAGNAHGMRNCAATAGSSDIAFNADATSASKFTS